jgi:GNAT superfamily N-acetyltransferase
MTSTIETHPLTPDRWRDLSVLFRRDRVSNDCWCMWFRETNAEYRANRGEPHRNALRRIVKAGPPPGILAYVEGRPAGWCAIAPREAYGRLRRSRVLAPVDDTPVWSITCFFIDAAHRGRGIGRALVEAAAALAAEHGGRIVEAYPVDTAGRRIADDEAYHGVASQFTSAGFAEVARRTPCRPIMRRAAKKRR